MTTSGAVRHDKDHYVTPRGVIVPLMAELAEFMGPHRDSARLRILDPGAGSGVITHALRETFPRAHITAVELDRTYEDNLRAMSGADEVVRGDFLHYGMERERVPVAGGGVVPGDLVRVVEPFDMIVGNPPFSLTAPFLNQAHKLLAPDGYMAMLLNTHAFGSATRARWWREHLPTGMRNLTPRPSFTGGGTDRTEYAWILWRGPTSIDGVSNTIWPPFEWYQWTRYSAPVVDGDPGAASVVAPAVIE